MPILFLLPSSVHCAGTPRSGLESLSSRSGRLVTQRAEAKAEDVRSRTLTRRERRLSGGLATPIHAHEFF